MFNLWQFHFKTSYTARVDCAKWSLTYLRRNIRTLCYRFLHTGCDFEPRTNKNSKGPFNRASTRIYIAPAVTTSPDTNNTNTIAVKGKINHVTNQANMNTTDSMDSDENKKQASKVNHSQQFYSKQDIVEQYCLNDKQLQVLNRVRQPPALFGCISSHRESSYNTRSSPNLLTACVRRRIPSDENLHELYKRLPADCAPYPQWTRYHHCHPDVFNVHHCHQSSESLPPPPSISQKSSYIRRHKCWPPEDEDFSHKSFHATCHGRLSGICDYTEFHHCIPHCLPPPPPPPSSISRMRHVSFARSHTVNSFDNVSLKSATSSKSLERLIDGKKTPDPVVCFEPQKVIVLEKKICAQKVQATQTDGVKSGSPATPHKVKLVSQKIPLKKIEHSVLQTPVKKYPRSLAEHSGNEILIDFEPKDPPYRRKQKVPLQKTVSDGEILIGDLSKKKKKKKKKKEDIETSVSDGEQCYKNLVAASFNTEESVKCFYENESIIRNEFYKSKSSVCLSDSPNKYRVKTPSSSNELEPSDLSQETVLQFEKGSKKIEVKSTNCNGIQKKIIRYTELPLQSSDLLEQRSYTSTGSECNTSIANVEHSEVSTSTEDFVTATDSTSYTTTPTQGPSVTSSTFESDSSKYSLPQNIFNHDFFQVSLDTTNPINEEPSDEDSSDDESSTSGSYSVKCSIENKKSSTSSDENIEMKPKSILKFAKSIPKIKLVNSDIKRSIDTKNINGMKKLISNIRASVLDSSDESFIGLESRRPSLRRKSVGSIAQTNSIEKKIVIENIDKRRESLPDINQKFTNATLARKSKTRESFRCFLQMNHKDNSNLKAVSAESLRSISPGSDSVFYSDPSNRVSITPRYLRCNIEVDTEYNKNSNNEIVEIFKPPEGFEDSPDEPPVTSIIRLNKRHRSEQRKRSSRPEQIRAKSEERVKSYKECRRPTVRSTNVSMERLNGSSSSLHSDDDDWSGVYTTPFTSFSWAHIDELEEYYVWKRPIDLPDNQYEPELKRRDSLESTCSEHEFRVKYQTITHRIVHRKSSLEMFKRLSSKSFDSDKRLIVKRESGGFGFRIHGAKPVVVSAIESGTAAENSGLQVGDIIISINNICVLDASHSEFVSVAHSGSDILELEVARTCDVLMPKVDLSKLKSHIVISSVLWKFSIGTKKMKNCWQPRYFCLKTDNCLYYYKSASLKKDRHPLGVLNLKGFTIIQTSDTGRLYSFRLEKRNYKKTRLHIAADSPENADRWFKALNEAIKSPSLEWLNEDNLQTIININTQSDCQGFLSTLVHHCGKSWKKYYCVLKDARLYFFVDSAARFANGMACLHGYKVQSSINTNIKRFAFELIPQDLSFRYFYFFTDTEIDKRRWIAALECSIDRWINIT
ncbi:uncharacterized protein LOC126895959 [Daktulosphaira vitifoliae]|uniref:uncharacterized protein LOC126895959 n=1 Tax=Daktulosphaira vitifoliae TaxID=58002 RepID=UPI0021AAA43F|nr:uncharacterized protein LOC126895959 [Daktulosphaira vitifoliae]